MKPEGEEMRADQMFYTTSGEANRQGHVSSFPDAETHVTESFAISEDGQWTPTRQYVWKRVKEQE